MKQNAWDAAVIGGGPAGCSAAIDMAQRGMRGVLFEAKTYPHDKLCGELLSPECSRLLCDLGLGDRLDELSPVSIQTVTLTAPDGMAWESPLAAPALGLSRKTLDAALADRARRAGVTVREAEVVRSVAGSLEEGFELDTAGRAHSRTEQARVVVAAHGKRGAIDRALGRKFLERRQPFVAFKAHFHGPPIPGRIELHAFQGGYCGMSEIEGREKVVCLLADERVFREAGGRGPEGIDRFITWVKSQNIYLRSWLQWAERIHQHWISVAQVSFNRKPLVEHDILMAGDSAGLIVPLAGNGIAMALEGGMLAASYLVRYLAADISADELRKQYSRAWRGRFSARLGLGKALHPLMLHPKGASLAMRFLTAFPSVGRFLIEYTRSPIGLKMGEKNIRSFE
jgi:flavin-dependent dehydrogenase